MNVTMVGAGYVGLVSGACLADVGNTITCIDTNAAKIAMLEAGEMPIYEPGLREVVQRTAKSGRLRFSTSLSDNLADVDAVFIAVGTPQSDDGSADLHQVEGVAREIGRHIEGYTLVVTKSTVPVGTAKRVKAIIAEELAARGVSFDFDVASNPEFLKEGLAVSDFLRPDRIVIGTDTEHAADLLYKIYRPFVLNGHPLLAMDVASAELTKYAANAMLAVRISFMNFVSQLCDETGASVTSVRQGIGSDPRIGSKFLYAGVGYGGSCFPKDMRALMRIGNELGIGTEILHAAESINERQKVVLVERLEGQLGSLAGRRVAIWGLAFKPNTDDVREAPALAMIRALVAKGADVVAYDPVASEQAGLVIGDCCEIVGSAYEALDAADALIVATEWPEFRTPDTDEMAKRMRGRIVLDGRNAMDAEALSAAGFAWSGIGLPDQALPAGSAG